MFPDYHLHSVFSTDSEADLYDMIHAAKQKGMSSICITDHYDMDFPKLPQAPDLNFDLDIDAYYAKLSSLQAKVALDFDLRIGIELGIMPNTLEKLSQYVKQHDFFDFIIASTHLVDNMDPYYPEYYEGKTEKEAFSKYFENILYFTENFHDYDVCGHIDYIVRYGPNQANNYRPMDYADIFEPLLKAIITNGKGIEINTGSLYKNLSFPHPHVDILKMYKALGGEIITIGSDAHKPEYIGYGFDIAKDYLLANDFKYYCTFKNRRPSFHKI